MSTYLVFDIGATKTRAAFAQENRVPKDYVVIPTPRTLQEGLSFFRKLRAVRKVDAVCGGIAGALDAKKERARTPHMPGWSDKPVAREMGKIFKRSVVLENDTALVGLGEAVYGAGRTHEIVAYITVSTGANGVRVERGRMSERALGFEIGHQIIAVEGQQPRMWEYFVGGSFLESRFGKDPAQIHDQKIWNEIEKYIAYGVANAIVHWSPHAVVLGGGVMNNPHIGYGRIGKTLRSVLTVYSWLPPLKKAVLGDRGGLAGAVAYLSQARQ